MKTLKLTSEQLRYKFKHIDSILDNRNVCNDEQLYEIYSKFVELIEDTDYKIDIVDLYTMLHCAMEDFEMYE